VPGVRHKPALYVIKGPDEIAPEPVDPCAGQPVNRLPKIAYGNGIHVYDHAGKRYIDASGGPAVFCLGHGNTEVNAAIKRQLDLIAHGYRYTFTSDPLEELRERVANACGADLTEMIFVSSGSEAVEAALKTALEYHTSRGEPTRRRFISRRRSWHGGTLGALSVSDFLQRRAPFEGALFETAFVPAVNAYRPPPGVAPEDVSTDGVARLTAEIERLGAEHIAGFIFEPVVGAAGGVVPAPPGYAEGVRETCSRYGVLMIADEVMCGSGRCGTWRALQHDGVVPDIMTVAKGLGGGFIPIAATIYRRDIGAILTAHGGPLSGHTFTGHTAACAAAVAVQTIIERDGLLDHVRLAGPRFMQMLAAALDGIAAVGDIRGRGFFVGIEFVADRVSREPFEAKLGIAARIAAAAAGHGLLVYACTGNVDGRRGDTVILSPPYDTPLAKLEEIAALFGRSVRAAVA